jgi:hypothetical protein
VRAPVAVSIVVDDGGRGATYGATGFLPGSPPPGANSPYSNLVEEILEETANGSQDEILDRILERADTKRSLVDEILENQPRIDPSEFDTDPVVMPETKPATASSTLPEEKILVETTVGSGLGFVPLLIGAVMLGPDTKFNADVLDKNWNPEANKNSYKNTAQQMLYVIYDPAGNVIKFGTSADPEHRYSEAEFRARFGEGAELVVITTGNVKVIRDLETMLIRRYSWLNGGDWDGPGMKRPPGNKANH